MGDFEGCIFSLKKLGKTESIVKNLGLQIWELCTSKSLTVLGVKDFCSGFSPDQANNLTEVMLSFRIEERKKKSELFAKLDKLLI